MPGFFRPKAANTPGQDARRALRRALDDPGWTLTGRIARARLEKALAREMSPDHPLDGMVVSALARALSSDDVLFACDTGQLALVHLTFSGQPGGADWPSTAFFGSVDEFLSAQKAERTYEAALLESFALGSTWPEGSLLCPACGADWGEAETGPDCALPSG